jgi:aspartate-semialdehyde dehydrogenase
MQALSSKSSLRGAAPLAAPRPRAARAARAAPGPVRAAKTADGPVVSIVGVTGAVGQEFLRVRPPRHHRPSPARRTSRRSRRCLPLPELPISQIAPGDLRPAASPILLLPPPPPPTRRSPPRRPPPPHTTPPPPQVLKERDFPYSDIRMLASSRSKGRKYTFDGIEYTTEELTEDSFRGVDIALFSAGGDQSKRFAPAASAAGAVVVDNSSAFRMTEGVPLVVPEINAHAMAGMRAGGGGIVANPNCSTIIALVAVTPLHRLAGVKRMVVSTYQAASGAGQAAMEELEQQTREVLAGQPVTTNIFPFQCVFSPERRTNTPSSPPSSPPSNPPSDPPPTPPRRYAFNLFSHNAPMTANGYNEEEMKLVKETRKIWEKEDVAITATCIRVPVMRAHAESINLEFESDISEAEAFAALNAAAGVTVMDDRANNRFPTPLDASNRDDVFVGRVRRDVSRSDNRGLDLFVCGDQIKKGAALNAVQIAELLV